MFTYMLRVSHSINGCHCLNHCMPKTTSTSAFMSRIVAIIGPVHSPSVKSKEQYPKIDMVWPLAKLTTLGVLGTDKLQIGFLRILARDIHSGSSEVTQSRSPCLIYDALIH